jgi:FkbM family methyltransferase
MEARVIRKGSLSRFQNLKSRILIFKNWYKLVLPFNRVFTGVQKLKLRNGKSAYVREIRSVDTIIVRDILWDDEYAIDQMTLPENAVVYDIGANIGTFSVGIKYKFPTARITAYEPHPENFKILSMNAPFATLEQKAAAETTGTVHLTDSKNFIGLEVVEQGGIEVEALSLNDILKAETRVDLLKIDIEGSEYGVLNGASPETFAKVQRLVMEVHVMPGIDDIAWAETILKRNGFSISWVQPKVLIYGEKKQ